MSAYAPIKIKYNPVVTYTGNTQNNFVGAQSVVGQRGTLPTFTNSNSIFVAKSGSNANPGTALAPVLTLNYAASILTAGIEYIVFLDSGTYNEILNLTSVPAGFVGIYAADGQAPVFEVVKGAIPGTYGAGNPARVVAYTPNYYISKTGNDATGVRGNPALPFLTIQGALNNGARVNGDILEIEDNGVYIENLYFGSLAQNKTATLRAGHGKIPTIQAVLNPVNIPTSYITTIPGSPYQITPPIPAGGTYSVDLGVVFTVGGAPLTKVASPTLPNEYSESVGVYTFNSTNVGGQITISYEYSSPSANLSWGFNQNVFLDGLILDSGGSTQYLHTGYGGTSAAFTNCSIINYATLGDGTNGFYTNCMIRNVVNYGYAISGPTPGATLNNTYSYSQTLNGKATTVNAGNAFGGATQCTFVNQIFTGNANQSNATVIDRCFFNNSSLVINDLNILTDTIYNLTNSIFYNGCCNIQRTGSSTPGNYTDVTLNNVVIYAYGQINGLSLSAPGTSGTEWVYATLQNVAVIGATTNFSAAVGPSSTLVNCSSANGTTGLATNGNMTANGFLDAGSTTPWTLVTPVNSESNAGVISTIKGTENLTLSANDGGMFYGPLNAANITTSAGIDYAVFQLQVSCVLNGLVFGGWTVPLQNACSSANQESGVQASPGVAVAVQYCTFNCNGTYGLKTNTQMAVRDCLFDGCAGHGIMNNSSSVALKNNIGVGCAGAFIANFGQAATIQHNSGYNCQYGQYDAPEVLNMLVDSNIYSGSGVYDYSGNATLTYSCVATLDPNTLAAVDSNSIQLDPLFQDANAGTATGLKLQSAAYGYLWNSPAIGAASDAKDMGAWDFTYGTPSTAYTTIDFSATVTEGGVLRYYRNPDQVVRHNLPIKLANGDREDGSIYSVAATYKASYNLTWAPSTNDMPLAQTAALLAMFKAPTNAILINWGDGRGDVPGYFDRQQGFEYTDMTDLYSDNNVPEPVKEIVLREA